MKELIKPVKETEVFENLNYTAFHEEGGSYSRGGDYLKGYYSREGYNVSSWYFENDNLDSYDDVLF